MELQNQYFAFTIDDQHYATELAEVCKVIRAVELIHLADAPDILLGLIDIKGKIIPVINIRKQFHLNDCEMDINDRIIIAQSSTAEIAFIVDKVEGIITFSPHPPPPDTDKLIKGIGRFNHETTLIINIDELVTISRVKGSSIKREE